MKTVIHALLTSLLLLSSVQTTVAQTLDEIVVRHLGLDHPHDVFPGYPISPARFVGMFAQENGRRSPW